MRVRYIHEEIRSRKYPNCLKLAKHFGVSVRTIYRDIEAMRGLLDLEIEFSDDRNGYYYTREVPADLPRPKLTSGEALAFCLAIRALERFRGTDFAELFERSLRKIMDEVEGEVAFEWQALDELVSFGPREGSGLRSRRLRRRCPMGWCGNVSWSCCIGSWTGRSMSRGGFSRCICGRTATSLSLRAGSASAATGRCGVLCSRG